MKMRTTVCVDKVPQHEIRRRIAHNTRSGRCDGVDETLSHRNRVLHGETVRPENVADLIKEIAQAKRFRKNAAVAYEVVVEAPAESLHWLDERCRAWEQRTLEWAKNLPGKLLQVVAHYDEQRPHIHCMSVPVFPETDRRARPKEATDTSVEKKTRRHSYGNLRAGDVIDRPFVRRIHDSYQEQVGREFGFKRGIRGVRGSQERLKHYGASISAKFPEISADQLDLDALPEPTLHVTAKRRQANKREIAQAVIDQLIQGPLYIIHHKALRNDELRAQVKRLEAALEAKEAFIEQRVGSITAALTEAQCQVDDLKEKNKNLEMHLGSVPSDLQLLEVGGITIPATGVVGKTPSGKPFRVTEGRVALQTKDGERCVTGLAVLREVAELSSRDALALASLRWGPTTAAALFRGDLLVGDRSTYSLSTPPCHPEPAAVIASEHPWAGDDEGNLKESLRGVVLVEPSGGLALLKRNSQCCLEGRTHLDREGRVVRNFGSDRSAIWGRGDDEGPLTLSRSVEVWADLCERVKGLHILVTDEVPVAFVDESLARRRRDVFLVDASAEVRAHWISKVTTDPRRLVREVSSADEIISAVSLDPTEQYFGKTTWGTANDGFDIS